MNEVSWLKRHISPAIKPQTGGKSTTAIVSFLVLVFCSVQTVFAQSDHTLRSPDQKPAFREAALGALYGGDKANIVNYVSPLLTDKSATPRLQAIGIQMTIDVRQSMAYRRKATKADAYDQLVRTIAEGRGVSTADELIIVAKKYLDSVRPRF